MSCNCVTGILGGAVLTTVLDSSRHLRLLLRAHISRDQTSEQGVHRSGDESRPGRRYDNHVTWYSEHRAAGSAAGDDGTCYGSCRRQQVVLSLSTSCLAQSSTSYRPWSPSSSAS